MQPIASPARLHGVRRTPLVATALLLVVSLSGCFWNDDKSDEPQNADGTTVMPTTLTTGPGTGGLPAKRREEAVAAVGAVVDGWWEPAFITGTGTPADVAASLTAFTDKAARKAKRQADILSLQGAGSIDGVTVTIRKAAVDLLAVKKEPVAAVAHVVLAFTTTGVDAAKYRLQGELQLTARQGVWQVIGFDLALADRPVPTTEGATS